MRGFGWLAACLGALWIAVFATLAVASDDDEERASRVPMPAEAKPLGEHCVEPTEFMKRNHMKLILHQRDKTMHQGIRTTKYSLKHCIYCHATATKENPAVRSVLGEGHFCQSCHAYNAVTIDCFECHSSKPGRDVAMPLTRPLGTSASDRLHSQASLSQKTAQAGAAK
ncbi:MAG: hypothetical protein WCA45_04470 [Thiobacillaceae bacterium]